MSTLGLLLFPGHVNERPLHIVVDDLTFINRNILNEIHETHKRKLYAYIIDNFCSLCNMNSLFRNF